MTDTVMTLLVDRQQVYLELSCKQKFSVVSELAHNTLVTIPVSTAATAATAINNTHDRIDTPNAMNNPAVLDASAQGRGCVLTMIA